MKEKGGGIGSLPSAAEGLLRGKPLSSRTLKFSKKRLGLYSIRGARDEILVYLPLKGCIHPHFEKGSP